MEVHMAHLIYTTNMSLDGFIEDIDGKFDWTDPSDEVFQFITDLIRTDGTHLYGRRTYEYMLVWETDPSLAGQSPLMRDFAQVWQAADKIVYSRTLEAASTRKTKIERNFDPEGIRRLKESVEQDIHIGGAELAAQAFRAGLIDECHLFIKPIILGGGKAGLPEDVRLELALLDERRFGNGEVYLRYGIRQARAT
jgi:dihydrofolate reductase